MVQLIFVCLSTYLLVCLSVSLPLILSFIILHAIKGHHAQKVMRPNFLGKFTSPLYFEKNYPSTRVEDLMVY